ncbi:MAG: L-rhamnose isomerase [Armatimonadetes bacterium]|jgi:L-rhamnose isomerase/sugar isomerase|nr:L-rhamnose isomerase [Armatimonadota bacterium]
MSAIPPLFEELAAKGLDPESIVERLTKQEIETPSWGYANSGTRFGTFRQPWAATNTQEKIADAATVHTYTGVAPSVAVHVKWDFEDDDADAVVEYARSVGVRIGAINPNVFQDQEYKLGSFGSPDPASRQKALDHCLESVEIGKKTGSRYLSLWFADGTNYPGQDDMRKRKRYFTEALQTVYNAMPETMTMLIEYKPFEPAFYHTDIADWGMSSAFARACGERAKVLVDLGHHLQGANVAHIVSFLLDEGELGGFHFNDSKYADDDLTTGSINPFELFTIYCELARAEEDPNIDADIAYMVDQSHNLKPKIEAMIQTVEQIQRAYAKALCVDLGTLRERQDAGDVAGAEQCYVDAFNLDVRPLLYAARERMGVPTEPLQAYRASGHTEKLAEERRGRRGASSLG